jgi:hypothetical protein
MAARVLNCSFTYGSREKRSQRSDRIVEKI